jgi:hypothetical protein
MIMAAELQIPQRSPKRTGHYHGGSPNCTLDARPLGTTGGFNLAEPVPMLKPQSPSS